MAKPANPPSVEDVQAIGNAAAGAAEQTSSEGGTPEQAGSAAATAAQAEAEARGIELPQAVIDQIAKASAAATVAELANQRAIVPAADDDDQEDDEDGDQGEPGEQGEEPKPTKQTFAQKLLSGYKS